MGGKGSKGQEIKYTVLGMPEYLLYKENGIIFTSHEEFEDMEYFHECEYLNIEEPAEKYEKKGWG
jgi:hypothetical protein